MSLVEDLHSLTLRISFDGDNSCSLKVSMVKSFALEVVLKGPENVDQKIVLFRVSLRF